MLDDEYLSGVLRVRVTSANGLKAKSRTFMQAYKYTGCCMYALGYFSALRLNCTRTVVCEHDACMEYLYLSTKTCVCACIHPCLAVCT